MPPEKRATFFFVESRACGRFIPPRQPAAPTVTLLSEDGVDRLKARKQFRSEVSEGEVALPRDLGQQGRLHL